MKLWVQTRYEDATGAHEVGEEVEVGDLEEEEVDKLVAVALFARERPTRDDEAPKSRRRSRAPTDADDDEQQDDE